MSEAALNAPAPPGWFGKLPNRGDFASRRLPDDFIRRWDDWLQHGLASARNELGDVWLARYLVAPIWRFWLAPDTLGAAAWAGLLMPSVDRVGRHFPLTIAAPAGPSAGSLAAVLEAQDWFRALDSVARQVLDVEFTVEDFEGKLAMLATPDFDVASDAEAQHLASALLQAFSPADVTPQGGLETPRSALLPGSVWWCDGAAEAAQFACFAALPPAASFAGLLRDGGIGPVSTTGGP